MAWFLASIASAQQRPGPTPEAVRLYQQGMAAFRGGQFAQAIGSFKAADALSPSASLSYDIAECYEKLADLRNARHYYEEYLRRAPNAEDRSKVEAELTSIDAQLIEAQRKTELAPSVPLVVTEEAKVQPPNRLASFILMGLGAAGLGVGIALDVAAQGKATQLTGATAPLPGSTAQSYYSDSKNYATVGITALVVGGAALVTGGVIFLVQTLGGPDKAPLEDAL